MPRISDPLELSPAQIRGEIARILATGVIRSRQARHRATREADEKSFTERLDVTGKTVLSGRHELTAGEAERSEPVGAVTPRRL